MSDALYYTRLRYHNGVGVAKKHGTTVTLTGAPDLGRGPVHELDYIPEIDQAEVSMDKRDPVRRMTRAEVQAADELLDHLTREIPRDACHYSEPWKDGRC
jgi:hypothetical protein